MSVTNYHFLLVAWYKMSQDKLENAQIVTRLLLDL